MSNKTLYIILASLAGFAIILFGTILLLNQPTTPSTPNTTPTASVSPVQPVLDLPELPTGYAFSGTSINNKTAITIATNENDFTSTMFKYVEGGQWEPLTLPENLKTPENIIFLNNTYYLTGLTSLDYKTIFFSKDGNKWVPLSTPEGYFIQDVTVTDTTITITGVEETQETPENITFTLKTDNTWKLNK